MTTQRQTQPGQNEHARTRSRAGFWLLGIVLLAPLGMGARDCENAVVGADCTEKANADNPACVCEYDGKYYAAGDSFKATDGCNQCGCQKDGEVACTLIGCASDAGSNAGDSCGGLTGAGCDDGEYCNFAPEAQCGAADQTGTCAQKTEICPAIYSPVCGCDDTTYSSACVAAGHGISVASKGECKGATDAGTGTGGCEYDGEHHEPGDSFPATDGCNTCNCAEGGSVGCTKIGCDPGDGTVCGARAGDTCAADEFCNFPLAAICGAADGTGTCAPKPEACDDIYKPVCGCDGKTYGNACEANRQDTSAASEGECGTTGDGCDVDGSHYAPGESFPASDGCNQCTCNENGEAACTEIGCEPGKTCGGFAGIQCDGEQYCDFPRATMCGSGDQSGTCRDKPEACDLALMPVCGCDGMDYSNACFASIAGTSVLHTGECE